MGMLQEATIFPLPSYKIPPQAEEEEVDRGKRGKIGWQYHRVDWKIIQSDSDIGTNSKYMEEAEEVLSFATIMTTPDYGTEEKENSGTS